MTTGQQLWSFASEDEPLAATDVGVVVSGGNGVSLVGFDGTVLESYPGAGDDVEYWTLARWRGRVTNTFVEWMGATAERSFVAGAARNAARQGSVSLPRIHTYIPIRQLVQPSPTDSERLSSAFKSLLDATLMGFATSLVRVESQALLWGDGGFLRSAGSFSIEKWLETVQPAEVVAFIGHGVFADDITPQTSIGLQFFDKDLLKLKHPSFPPGQEQWVGPRGQSYGWWADKIRTEAKVIFVSSCLVGPEFLSLWDLPSGGALIYSQRSDVYTPLNHGAESWRIIALQLSLGANVATAVAAANSEYAIFPYTFIGNGNATIKPNFN